MTHAAPQRTRKPGRRSTSPTSALARLARRRPLLAPIAVYDSHDPHLPDRNHLNAWARSQGLWPSLAYRWEIFRTDHLWVRAYEYAAEPDGTLIWDHERQHPQPADAYDIPLTTPPPDLWILELPSGLPLLSANDRSHYRVRAERTRALRTAAAHAAETAALPRLNAAHVTAEYRPGPRARRRDPANWSPSFKAAADGLVDAGTLPDDDATRMLGPDPRLGLPDPDAARAGVRWGRIVLYIREHQPTSEPAHAAGGL